MKMEELRSWIAREIDLNGGDAESALIVRDPSPGPMYSDVYAVRVQGAIDLLVYVPQSGPVDFEEVVFDQWPPRSRL